MKEFDYCNLFNGGTKLSIDPTTEIKFDESTKFNLNDYIKMKEEGKKIDTEFYKRMFESIPTVSMSIFSWWKDNKTKHSECPCK